MLKTCPISNTLIDENVVRLNGFFTILVLIATFFYLPIFYFISIDFLIRSVKVKYSPSVFVSKNIINFFKIKAIPIDFAPKKFAVRMGFTITLVLLLLNHFNYIFFFDALLIFFILAVVGETFFRFCLGCKIYSLINTIKSK